MNIKELRKNNCGSKTFRFSIKLIILMLFSITAHAVGVRGRIDFVSPQGIFPMSGVVVNLCHVNAGGCMSYMTGMDGMYYFNAIPGPHNIVINGQIISQIMVPNQPYFDIQPLRGN